MLRKELENLIKEMEQIDPNLKEEIIKPLLMQKSQQAQNYSIEYWITTLVKDFSMHKNLVKEIEFLYDKYRTSELDFHQHRANNNYKSLVEGKVRESSKVFSKIIKPFHETEIEVSWSASKARELIKVNGIQKTNFPFNQMEISFTELDIPYLDKAAKNKEAGILLQYEPIPNKHFPLDGNHRITGQYIKKSKHRLKGSNINFLSPSYIKNSTLSFPVYYFSSEESLKSMEHPFFQYFYLIHFLYSQIGDIIDKGSVGFDDIVMDGNSRYNTLRKIVI